MLATGLLTLFVATAVLPARPGLVGLAAFGASLTKETGYPFVVALGLVALLLARRRTGEPIRRHVQLAAAGMTLALAASSMLNVIRFGTPRNAYYLDPGLRTTGIDQFLENVAGLFIAPNGGLLVFWPLATSSLCSSSASPRPGGSRDVTVARSVACARLAGGRWRGRRRACGMVGAVRLVGVGISTEPAVGARSSSSL